MACAKAVFSISEIFLEYKKSRQFHFARYFSNWNSTPKRIIHIYITSSAKNVVVRGLFDQKVKISFFEKSSKIRNSHGEAKARLSLKGNIDKMGVLEFGRMV